MNYAETPEFQLCRPNPDVKNAVRHMAWRLFGGPVMDTTVETTLAVCIAAGALDEERLAAHVGVEL